MLTIPTIPGQDTIGIYGGGFNSPSTDIVGNFYLLTDPTSTYYLVSPDNNNVYPSYPSVFSPLSLAPALWLDDTGSDPSVWTDMSGNGRNASQSDPAKCPSIVTNALYGKQVRRFDGVDDYLITANALDWAFLHGSTSSTFIVFRAGNVADPETIYALCGTSLSVVTPGGAYYAHDTRSSASRDAALLHVIGIGGPNTVNARQNAVAGNTWAIMSAIGDPQNYLFADRSKIWSNGSGPTAANTEFNPSYLSQPRHSLAIGSAQNSSSTFSSFLLGDITEILVFPTALSDVNRQQVEQYLSAKYGIPLFDPDATDYFARIAAAGSSITDSNKLAVNAFITGCKVDGIWNAIKASCLLAGPDSLAGALVPLVGAAPTNVNFVSGDYNRTTGLVGDGTTKYLNSNRNNNADPQNNQHLAVRVTSANTTGGNSSFIGTGLGDTGCSQIINTGGTFYVRTRCQSAAITDQSSIGVAITGTVAISRNSSSTYNVLQQAGVVTTVTVASETPFSQNTVVFGRNLGPNSNARISFYSIGESLNLALLDTRLTTYMTSLT